MTKRWLPFGTILAASLNMAARVSLRRSGRLGRRFRSEYFVIQAMARMNRHDEALASIRDHFGGQLEYGGTSFFETFWPAWAQVPIGVFCHPSDGADEPP